MPKIDYQKIIKEYKLQIIFLGLGTLFVAGGLIYNKISNHKASSAIEVISESPATVSGNEIIIDVRGSVITPGVYHLGGESRVEDALVAAGGLSPDADTSWTDKNLDRAAKLFDGQKIYIPKQSEVLSASNINQNTNVAQYNSSTSTGMVSINSATLNQLVSLPGIGQVYGQSIIDHRPYSSLDELVSKKVIGQSVFDKIKDKIILY